MQSVRARDKHVTWAVEDDAPESELCASTACSLRNGERSQRARDQRARDLGLVEDDAPEGELQQRTVPCEARAQLLLT
eukprot:3775048-Rhodomonas_salina.1